MRDRKSILLGDVCSIKTGKRNNQDKDDNGLYPFFVRSSVVEKINTYSFDGEAILMPGEGNIGDIIHYINGKFDFHQRVYKISNFDNNLCGKYVFYALQKSFKKWALKNTVKATVDSLRLPTFQTFSFYAPKKEYQEKIVQMLDAVVNHISNIEKLIAKQESIKKTTQFLLLQPKDNWNKITLGDICDITGAGVDKKINPNEERCVLLNYLDVYHKTYIYSSDLHHVVSAPKKQKLRCSVKKNDIFFTPSSETPDDIARSCVAMEDMQDVAYSYHIVRARPKVECNSLFIKYMCSTNDFLLQAQTACVGSGKRYVISLPKVREFVIYIPDIE